MRSRLIWLLAWLALAVAGASWLAHARLLALEEAFVTDARIVHRVLSQRAVQHDAVMATLQPAYGDAAPLWFQRWRMFWMSCAELFGYDQGREWMVAHYRFNREG